MESLGKSDFDHSARKIEAIRQECVSLLEHLHAQAAACVLPPPPPALETYRHKLVNRTYNVLVVGEAKRGKSTFVNALIGREILPMDVDVATSQVFQVRHAEHEAFRLRFEDGSERAITAADLSRYGSQVLQDVEGVPRLDQIIRCIEVDVPIRFLPQGLSLLDTPGLGSLYATHIQITQRFISEADAVIFVLDSGQPLGHQDLEFIESLLKSTRNIFFVQTKIDQHRRAGWEEMRRRNEEILGARFHGCLRDVRVWPISSTNLLKAARTGDRDYLEVSRHSEFAAALQAFLARVAGVGRSAEALMLAQQYQQVSLKALGGRLAALTEESKQKRAELQRLAMQSKQQFDAQWGRQGQKRAEIMSSIQQIAAIGKQNFIQAIQPGGAITVTQEAKISATTSLDEANQVGRDLTREVVAAATNHWQDVRQQVEHRCVEVVGSFISAASLASAPLSAELSGLQVGALKKDFNTDWWLTFRGMYSGVFIAMGVQNFLPMLGLALPAFSAPLVAIGAFYAVNRAWHDSKKTQLQNAQQELRKYLNDVLGQVRQFFLNVDLASGRFSMVDEYFSALQRTVSEQLDAVIKQKSAEAQAEVARLTQAVNLDDPQRKARAEHVQQQLAGWENLGRRMDAVATTLTALAPSPMVDQIPVAEQ